MRDTGLSVFRKHAFGGESSLARLPSMRWPKGSQLPMSLPWRAYTVPFEKLVCFTSSGAVHTVSKIGCNRKSLIFWSMRTRNNSSYAWNIRHKVYNVRFHADLISYALAFHTLDCLNPFAAIAKKQGKYRRWNWYEMNYNALILSGRPGSISMRFSFLR